MNPAKWVSAAMILAAGSCLKYTPDSNSDGGSGSCVSGDMRGTSNADMAVAAPKCAAAAGLSGDNLLCVDFTKIASLTDASLSGWDFNKFDKDCWQVSGGVLSVKNFAAYMGNCGLTVIPLDLKQADKQKYQRLTIALLHRLDLSDPEQKAQIFMGLDDPTRLLHQTTGKPGIPTLTTTTLTVDKTDLPAGLMSVYQFLLKVGSLTPVSGRQGWQIQSIAVNGLP